MASIYQYWRLYFNGPTNGTSVVAIAEWNFYDGSSIAVSRTGGTASASSVNSGAWVAANAFNANVSDAWASLGNPSSGSPEWLQYQFTGAVTVSFISLTVRNDSSAWLSQNPTAFLVQGSPDGVTWTTLETYTGVLWLYGAGETLYFDASTTVGNARVSQTPIEVITSGPHAAVSQVAGEFVGASNPHGVVSQLPIEIIGGSAPHVQGSQIALEVLGGSRPNAQVSQVCVELMYPYVAQDPTQIYVFILP